MTDRPPADDDPETAAAAADPAALHERLFLELYEELRDLAASLLRRESPDHTLQPTALVHEAWFKLLGTGHAVGWEGRAHFFGAAARAMRQVLVDSARRKAAARRFPAQDRVTLEEDLLPGAAGSIELLVLNDLLDRLAELDARMARIVELRVFGGLTAAETALVLGVSPRTVEGDWALARKWLRREMA